MMFQMFDNLLIIGNMLADNDNGIFYGRFICSRYCILNVFLFTENVCQHKRTNKNTWICFMYIMQKLNIVNTKSIEYFMKNTKHCSNDRAKQRKKRFGKVYGHEGREPSFLFTVGKQEDNILHW